MLIALPLLTFAAIYFHVWDSRRIDSEAVSDWRGSFLIASLLWGALLVVITEGLGLARAIGRIEIASLWAGVLLILTALGVRRGLFRAALANTRIHRNWFSIFEWSIIIGIMFIVLSLAIVAWIAPPNTTDSLLYHMPRVAHWIQQSSLNHYPTAYVHQLWASPLAEMTILNFQILWGSDQPSNMVQWFSLMGSLLGVSALAKLLGANRRGQLLSAAFALSIPMALLQATSTQTDLVTAFWLICLIYFVTLSKRRRLSSLEKISIALSTGLGMLTKGSFYPLALPILLWFFLPRLRSRGIRRTLQEGIFLGALILLLNLGFWASNVASFGGPLGPSEAIDNHTELSIAPQVWISNILRHVAVNFATPEEAINSRIASTIDALHDLFGVRVADFELTWAWNHEDFAGNPLHITALILIFISFGIYRSRINSKLLKAYLLVVLGSFLLFSVVIQVNQFVMRLQLPLLMISAPAVGATLAHLKPKPLNGLLLVGLLGFSLPWVFFNSTRPIVAMRPGPEPWAIPCKLGCTRTGSVFFRSREDLLFANWTEFQEPITTIAKTIESSGCQRVGLRLDSRDREYLYWWFLGAPNDQIQIKSISTYPDLEKYLDPYFEPCAVICTTCGYRTEAFGLKLRYNRQLLSLFMGENFSKDIDS